MLRQLSRWLCSLMLFAVIAGCASIAPDQTVRERLVLERSDEILVQTRAGRFVLQGQAPNLGERGTQGRFEWLEYRSSQGAPRQVLIWLGPLGQSAASLEQRWQPVSGPAIAAYDEQGLRLTHQDQLRFLSAVLGRDALAMSDDEVYVALQSIMRFFQASVNAQATRHESQFLVGKAVIDLRIAFDQP